MKKIILLFWFVTSIISTVYSQWTTYYGTDAGTKGTQNTNFGHGAGEQATSTTNDNTAIGAHALRYNDNGTNNVAVGSSTMESGGSACVAVGSSALYSNGEYGTDNTALGYRSMRENWSGDYNTAVGSAALHFNQASYNSGLGFDALFYNEYGNHNTAFGYRALYSNTSHYNIAVGSYSLYSNNSGQMNTASGYSSLYSNTTGFFNTAVGGYALNYNINGSYNTATGYQALYANNTGTNNTAHGYLALTGNTTGSYNTASGTQALNKAVSGSYNSGLGYRAGQATNAHLENTTALGYLATPTASNQVRLGNTSVTSIGGQASWTAFSDGRFKKDIKEDVSGLDFINDLRPVSYTVDKVRLNEFLHVSDSSSNLAEAKSAPERQTGFIAQEVEALVKKIGYVFSGVDAPENENDPYGLRYAEFVVPLVKGMQELTAIMKAQEQKIIAQEQKLDSLVNRVGSKREIEKAVNDQAVLLQNNPNPFNTETEIKMTVPEGVGFATVMIYNLEGKQMKNIQVRDRGQVSVKISGSELSAGMYLYALIADGKVVDTKRMILTQ